MGILYNPGPSATSIFFHLHLVFLSGKDYIQRIPVRRCVIKTRMKAWTKIGILVFMVFSLAGCFGSSWVIKLKSDGSGTIEMEYHLDSEIIAMMQSMGGGDGEMATTSEELME